MLRTVIRINPDKYELFMRIQMAKSWKSYKDFYSQFWVCPNTYYSWKYKKRIKTSHYENIKKVLWDEEWFNEIFSIWKEPHWNVWIQRKKTTKKIIFHTKKIKNSKS